MSDKTLEYYNTNAEKFVESTCSVDFSQVQCEFLNLLRTESYILDFGCGSGRDTKYFLEHGYQVDAVDGSMELCRIASEFTGIEVRQMLFQELQEKEKYDGIWACASILHVPKIELADILQKMCNAVKVDGVIYISLKYGNFEGEQNGRFFSDFTEKSFCEFVKNIQELCIQKMWITGDVRDGRGDERWLNIILRRKMC